MRNACLLALVAVALAACGKPATITVSLDRADVLAEPRAGAKIVGELLPGTALPAKRPGLFGAKGFYQVRVGEQVGYVSEAQAEPVPLPGAPMMVLADSASAYADRALSSPAGEPLRFGAAVEVYEVGSDEKALVLLKDGVRAGFLKREEAVPAAAAAERLGAKVVEAARAGEVTRALLRAGALKGAIALSAPAQALAEALRQAEAGATPRDPAAAPLRTGAPPEAGARAFVAPLSLRAFANAQLSGAPVAVLELNQPVDVIELGERAAQVKALAFERAAVDPDEEWKLQLSGTPVEPALPQEPVFVDARALQREEQKADDLRARAKELGRADQADERFELLARAAALRGAAPDAFEKLFDEAFAAGAMKWAAWAAERWRFVDMVVWTTAADPEAAGVEAEKLAKLGAALATPMQLAAEALEGRGIEGIDPRAHLVVAGLCREGEPVTQELLAFLDELRPGGSAEVRRVRLATSGASPSLRCPGFREAQVNNCERKSFWAPSDPAEIASGKRKLRAWQFTYESESCGDWYEAERGVVTVFALYDRSGGVIAADASAPPIVRSNLGIAFGILQSSLQASGNGLVATFDTTEELCNSRYYEVWREGVRAKVDGDGIALEELRRKRLKRDGCIPASETSDELGD